LTLHLQQAVFSEQRAQTSPIEEVAAIPEMAASRQAFDG
jgi:hypothetical protein